jgi:predicted RNA binding protein YcfA (HicA-like mRNA interferase family)
MTDAALGCWIQDRVENTLGDIPVWKEVDVPRKIRELIADLEAAGFEDRGGKGSHQNFVHPKVAKPLTISGKAGDDAKKYLERFVSKAIEESKS